MPDPADYKDKKTFIADCIAQRQDEHPDEDVDQSAAVCYGVWAERGAEGSHNITTLERRASQLVEIRARGRRLEGYAAVFNKEARIGDFIETIAPGAFLRSMGGDVVALVDHDVARLLGRTASGSLRLAEDGRGLAFNLDVPHTTWGSDVLALAERGDIGGASFGFTVPSGGDAWDGNKRTLRNVDLKEISIVSSWPAYEGTSVIARAKVFQNGKTNFRLTLARRYLETL